MLNLTLKILLVGHIDYRIGNKKCSQQKLNAVMVHEISPPFRLVLRLENFIFLAGVRKDWGLTVTAQIHAY